MARGQNRINPLLAICGKRSRSMGRVLKGVAESGLLGFSICYFSQE